VSLTVAARKESVMRLRSIAPLSPEQHALFASGQAPLELVECVQGYGKGEHSRPATAAELEWVGQKWDREPDGRWGIMSIDWPVTRGSVARSSRYDLRKATAGALL
jgi:hypothetical protein